MRRAAKQKGNKRYQAIRAGGMVTSKEPWLIAQGKLEQITNLRLIATPNGMGGLSLQAVTRPGTRRLTSDPLPGPANVKAHLRYQDIDYLASETKIYRVSAGSPVLIGDIAQKPELIPYRGKVIVLDGSYAKSIDPDDAFSYSIIWDNDGYLWDWLSESQDSSQALYSGATTRFGFKDSTPGFGVGQIPISQVSVYLSRTGSPAGSLTVKVFAADGATLLGSGTLSDLTTRLGASPTLQAIDLSPAAGQTLDTPQNTDRYVVVEYTSGDASNNVAVHCANVASGGKGVSYNGSWSLVATKQPLMCTTPGLPPMASTGAVREDRLWLGGGNWPDEADKSKAHYSGLGNCYSWGSRIYVGGTAGWIGVDRLDGGVINQITGWFGGLVISKQGRQSMHMINGHVPGSDLTCTRIFTHEGAKGKTMASTGNALLFLNDEVLALEGVQGFGDVRKFPRSQDIQNLINSYATENAFSVHHRPHDQFWLQLEGYAGTLVHHILPRVWTLYEWQGFTPTCFSHDDSITYIGADDGHLYCLDDSISGRDAWYSEAESGEPWEAEAWGPMLSLGDSGSDKHFKGLTYELSARMGCNGSIMFRRDYAKVTEDRLTKSFSAPLDDDVSVSELISLSVGTDGLLYSVGGGGGRLTNQRINFVAKLAQVGLLLNPGGEKVYLGPVTLDLAGLGKS